VTGFIDVDLLRYTAFSSDPAGGNRAGVVLDATGTDAKTMQAIAAEVGYSETAFLLSRSDRRFDVRFFSPLAEVPFCGHATIAAAVAYAERHGPGPLTFLTRAGEVPIETTVRAGRAEATLTSVEPRTSSLPGPDLDELLAALRWGRQDLDPSLPPRVAYAGAWHPIVAVTTRPRLAALDYDYPRLASLMAARDWTTVDLVHRTSAYVFHARNPFPPGGVVEDPATGAAAAAFGGYLRELGAVVPPATLRIHQGDDLGRPGVLTIGIPPTGGIRVTGTAVTVAA
jgi:PhzF family phenazine biosynthesis protein